MNLKFFPLLLLCFCWQLASTQITFTSADAPSIGDVQIQLIDTLPNGVSIGDPGADQVWDFSNLQYIGASTTNVVDPATTEFGADFPDANLAFVQAFGTNYVQLTGISLTALGFSGDFTGTGIDLVVPFDPAFTFAQFPTTFGTNYTSNYEVDVTVDASNLDLGLPVTPDSIRYQQIVERIYEVDGYGEVITPEGTYDALRARIDENRTDSVWALFPFVGWQFIEAASGTTISLEYEWLAKEAKGAIVSVEFDEFGNISQTSYANLNELLPPVAAFSFTENLDPDISFVNESQNTPLSWSWDFGDGTTSTEQNPTHTFTANGVYTVCLTVTNSEGSDMTCHEVTILNGVLAPVAAFSFTENLGPDISFVDESLNTPLSWSWDFGDGTFDTEQNPIHTFTENGVYTVCLTVTNSQGSDVTCHEVTIMVLSANDIYKNDDIKVSPVPANTTIQFTVENISTANKQITILNALGQQVWTGDLANNRTINVSDWGQGLYFYQIINTKNQQLVATNKLIIKR